MNDAAENHFPLLDSLIEDHGEEVSCSGLSKYLSVSLDFAKRLLEDYGHARSSKILRKYLICGQLMDSKYAFHVFSEADAEEAKLRFQKISSIDLYSVSLSVSKVHPQTHWQRESKEVSRLLLEASENNTIWIPKYSTIQPRSINLRGSSKAALPSPAKNKVPPAVSDEYTVESSKPIKESQKKGISLNSKDVTSDKNVRDEQDTKNYTCEVVNGEKRAHDSSLLLKEKEFMGSSPGHPIKTVQPANTATTPKMVENPLCVAQKGAQSMYQKNHFAKKRMTDSTDFPVKKKQVLKVDDAHPAAVWECHDQSNVVTVITKQEEDSNKDPLVSTLLQAAAEESEAKLLFDSDEDEPMGDNSFPKEATSEQITDIASVTPPFTTPQDSNLTKSEGEEEEGEMRKHRTVKIKKREIQTLRYEREDGYIVEEDRPVTKVIEHQEEVKLDRKLPAFSSPPKKKTPKMAQSFITSFYKKK